MHFTGIRPTFTRGALSALVLAFAPGAVSALRAADLPLSIDAAHSQVEIVVKATVDSFTGSLSTYDASVSVDPATEHVTAARFAFKFSDVKTGNDDRDEQMHEWQDTPAHPDGVFELTRIERDPAGAAHAVGTLTFHGVAKEMSFPVSVSHDAGRYAIDGDATVDTRRFGLPIIRKFMVLRVDPEVHVRFHLQGSIEAATEVQP